MGMYDIMDERNYISVSCDLCGKDETNLLYNKGGFHIVRCKNCGLVYVNPRLKMEKLGELYNKNVISPFDYYFENRNDDEKTFKDRLNLIEKYSKRGRLLDLGCAIGTLSNVAKKNGWDVYGVDINKKSVNYCKEVLGLNVKEGNFEELEFQEDFFDVVLMNDFLEHVPLPTKALEKTNRILKKGGIIFIVTPKLDSGMAKISKARWLHLKPNEHLYYFSSKTMKKFLEKTGFKVEYITPIGRYRNLNTIFYKASIYGDFLYKIFRILVDNRIGRRLSINLNLRDEMAVIARKV